MTMKRMCHAASGSEGGGRGTGRATRRTYVLGGQEEAFPVELLVFCFLGRAGGRSLLGLGLYHAGHLNVSFLLAKPHGGRVAAAWLRGGRGRELGGQLARGAREGASPGGGGCRGVEAVVFLQRGGRSSPEGGSEGDLTCTGQAVGGSMWRGRGGDGVG